MLDRVNQSSCVRLLIFGTAETEMTPAGPGRGRDRQLRVSRHHITVMNNSVGRTFDPDAC